MSEANNEQNGTNEAHGRVARSKNVPTPAAAETTMSGLDQPSNPVSGPTPVHHASSSESGRGGKGRSSVPRARRMKLSLTKVDPWSITKVSFLLSVALMIIQIIAVLLIWLLLDSIGLFSSIDSIVSSTGLSTDSGAATDFFTLPTVLSATTIFSIFEIILLTALATIGAFLYNIVSALVGGVHVTLGDD